MPIYRLRKEMIFPSAENAAPDGLLAVGGDLQTERLLLAYQLGIFPWYSQGLPILWWSPDPRVILEPRDLHISRRLRQTIQKGSFKVTFDQAFTEVIQDCAEVRRRDQDGTWITPEMQQAYTRLYELGFAHSVESWFRGKLVGGVYGVSLGRCFFGESMFFHKTDASKVAFVTLVQQLKDWRFQLIDAQVKTQHLISLGAKEIPRSEFLQRLKSALTHPTIRGKWEPRTLP